ncbi:MAG: hypothetical protein AAFV62_08710 [Pseudomonadota bacterium]
MSQSMEVVAEGPDPVGSIAGPPDDVAQLCPTVSGETTETG